MSGVLGIHHVTAIASDPQRNVNFHAGVLGLRLVKRTVNFDDPHTDHLLNPSRSVRTRVLDYLGGPTIGSAYDDG